KDDWHHHIGDLLLVPKWPKTFSLGSKKLSPGAHGYNPYLVKDMHAIFYAWGPAFKNNLSIPSFENVNVYPVITSILGLTIQAPIDGSLKVAQAILK
ncbi:MAG TPA: alkaline phosphatase family protein, partial [Ferruginibacter sp.]|nr:alkaline phosphatase family protein [Ferruginibacter sp.]